MSHVTQMSKSCHLHKCVMSLASFTYMRHLFAGHASFPYMLHDSVIFVT